MSFVQNKKRQLVQKLKNIYYYKHLASRIAYKNSIKPKLIASLKIQLNGVPNNKYNLKILQFIFWFSVKLNAVHNYFTLD